MSALLIQNAGAVVTMNETREILYGVDILCDDCVFKCISQSDESDSHLDRAMQRILADNVIDAEGMIVYP